MDLHISVTQGRCGWFSGNICDCCILHFQTIIKMLQSSFNLSISIFLEDIPTALNECGISLVDPPVGSS